MWYFSVVKASNEEMRQKTILRQGRKGISKIRFVKWVLVSQNKSSCLAGIKKNIYNYIINKSNQEVTSTKEFVKLNPPEGGEVS